VKVSGKLVIVCIITVALAAAGASWWFRFNSTNRAAKFWGPVGSRLIRDAPRVVLIRSYLVEEPKSRDISNAPGITHLRNALLEDRSFRWSQGVDAAPKSGGWKLEFSNPATTDRLTIHFTTDCRGAMVPSDLPKRAIVSTEPISTGLREIFEELFPEADAKPR
jgi:hypothetical protein